MTTKLFDLKGKIAIVTGGNGGIGLGIARGLAEAGADIAVVGRNEGKSKAAAAELAGRGVKAILPSRIALRSAGCTERVLAAHAGSSLGRDRP
jgi:NAD(P)-dependent dehydrogenase (short-subunit alcohol dehydrogenase family)